MNPIRSPMLFLFLAASLLTGSASADEVQLVRTPHDGIQPQVAMDARGGLHLIYFNGKPDAGDLFYVTRAADAERWSKPVRVNSEPGSAHRNGVISHAQLALGPRARVHVTWFSMRPPGYYYTRSRQDAPGFEPQRKLDAEHIVGAESGASVAADGAGNVAVVWHAGGVEEEGSRGVYAMFSADQGGSFGPESKIDDGRGVCACCGLSAAWTPGGTLYVMYRAATEGVHRDMTLLESHGEERSFSAQRIHEWTIPGCPVSTTKVRSGRDGGALLAWETEGQVYVSERGGEGAPRLIAAPGRAAKRRKNPVAVTNPSGHTLLAWGEGNGWRSGGTLHWQVFDEDWKPTKEKGKAGEMPERSVPTAVALPDGTFVLIY